MNTDKQRFSQLIRTLRQQYKKEIEGIDTFKDINAGQCVDFAWDLIEKADKKKILGAQYRTDKHEAHAWVKFQGRYYDAEVPRGAKHWWDLPFWKRRRVMKEEGLDR